MSGSSTIRKETTFIKSLQVYAEIFSTGVRHQQITVRPTLILVSSSCTIPLPLARNQNKGGSASCCNPSRFPPKDHPRTKPPVTDKIFFAIYQGNCAVKPTTLSLGELSWEFRLGLSSLQVAEVFTTSDARGHLWRSGSFDSDRFWLI